MTIKQIESTPIGDYFHDCGMKKIFAHIEDTVDEFEVESDTLICFCDELVSKIKGLKSVIKTEEQKALKKNVKDQIKDMGQEI